MRSPKFVNVITAVIAGMIAWTDFSSHALAGRPYRIDPQFFVGPTDSSNALQPIRLAPRPKPRIHIANEMSAKDARPFLIPVPDQTQLIRGNPDRAEPAKNDSAGVPSHRPADPLQTSSNHATIVLVSGVEDAGKIQQAGGIQLTEATPREGGVQQASANTGLIHDSSSVALASNTVLEAPEGSPVIVAPGIGRPIETRQVVKADVRDAPAFSLPKAPKAIIRERDTNAIERLNSSNATKRLRTATSSTPQLNAAPKTDNQVESGVQAKVTATQRQRDPVVPALAASASPLIQRQGPRRSTRKPAIAGDLNLVMENAHVSTAVERRSHQLQPLSAIEAQPIEAQPIEAQPIDTKSMAANQVSTLSDKLRRIRPVAASRKSVTPPAPVGALPTIKTAHGISVPYRSAFESTPTEIGTAKHIGTVTDSRSAEHHKIVKRNTVKQIETSERKSVVPVVHHPISSQPTTKNANHVMDLVVGDLPVPSKVASTRRVVQTAGEESTHQGVVELPLLQTPLSNNATIDAQDELVTLVATDAELRGVLRLIADHHKLNLVVGPDVTGPVTVSIRGARLEEVLDAILGVAGYHWHRVGNLLYVTSSNASLDPRVQGKRLQVYPLNYVLAEDVQRVVDGLLSPMGQAFISTADKADQLRNRELLVVEDNEASHSRVSQYLAQVDIEPRQVLIEAHILQVDLGNKQRHGINLRALAHRSGAKVIACGRHSAHKDIEGGSFPLRVDGNDMGSLIKAIKSGTNARTLASPKVSVVNRQQAKIQIGQRLPYSVATSTPSSTIQNVQFLDVGIVLNVTPVISDDGNILMTVLPKVSGGRMTENGLPEEDTTEVNTTVLIPDGGGLVIGGLIREANLNNDAMMSGLGRVPVVKHLFRRSAKECQRSELVIALVTHIVDCTQSVRHCEVMELQDALPDYAESELRAQQHYHMPAPIISN